MNSILRVKAKDYAKGIIRLSTQMKENKVDFSISSQVIRSGTSIGANLQEARYAQSTRDFVSKLHIALKECAESSFWLDILYETNIIPGSDYMRLSGMCSEIEKMLIASIKTTKERMQE